MPAVKQVINLVPAPEEDHVSSTEIQSAVTAQQWPRLGCVRRPALQPTPLVVYLHARSYSRGVKTWETYDAS